MKKSTITYPAILIAIIGIIGFTVLDLGEKKMGGVLEPVAVELSASEDALLERIINEEFIATTTEKIITYDENEKEIISYDEKEITYKEAVKPNEGQDLLDMIEKLRIQAGMSQTDYFNKYQGVNRNQVARELNDLIK